MDRRPVPGGGISLKTKNALLVESALHMSEVNTRPGYIVAPGAVDGCALGLLFEGFFDYGYSLLYTKEAVHVLIGEK